jgi:AcrR family transcriptional regulator
MNDRSDSENAVTPLRERIRQATAQAILEAAEAVFAEQGLQASVGEIAARAGVAVGTLYNYFTDRDALVTGLLELRGDQLLEHVDAQLAASARAPFPEQLTAFLRGYLQFFHLHRPFFRILFQGELHRLKVSLAPVKALYERCEKLVKRGVRERAVRAEAGDLAMPLVMGMMRSLVMRELFSGARADEADAPRIAEVILKGIST